MRTNRLGTYTPGRSVLHRSPAVLKVVLLFAFSLAVVLVRGPASSMVALAIAVGLHVIARTGTSLVLRALRSALLVAVLLGAFAAWTRGPWAALEAVGDVASLILAAAALTATTRLDDLVAVIARAAAVLRPLGVNPEQVALAMALMIRAVPEISELVSETAQAARARGLDRSPRAHLIPLALRTVARARATGEAMAARGIGDD